VAKTTYSHSIFPKLVSTPTILLFFVIIFLTGHFSIIVAPFCFAALAKTFATPTGSACPSFLIKTPPTKSSVFISGYISFISSLSFTQSVFC